MGRLSKRHYIEVITEKGKTRASCSCGWKEANKLRNEVYALAHIHIANLAIDNHSV